MSLLPNQSQVNADTSFFAPAGSGGGGGGGPNLTVSTIVVNPTTNGITFPNATSSFTMQYDTILNEANQPISTICFENNAPSVSLGLDVAVGGLYIIGDGGNVGSASSAHLNLAGTTLTVQAPVTGGTISLLSPTSVSSLSASTINAGAVYLENINAAGQYPYRMRANSGTAFIENSNTGEPGDLTVSTLTVSSINGAVPGGGGSIPGNLTVSSLTLAGDPTALGGTLEFKAVDTDLYEIQSVSSSVLVAGLSLGTVGGRNQVYMDTAEADDLMVSSITAVAGGNIQMLKPVAVSSIVGVSTINGAAYPPAGSGVTNYQVPFIGGTVNTNQYIVNVDSNTVGIPVALTSTLITNSSHKYLVSYSLASGSNSDTTSYTQISLYAAAGGNPTMQTAPGYTNYWFYNGNVGSRSVIISGAAALRLEAGTNSASQSTILYFDNNVGFAIADLGT